MSVYNRSEREQVYIGPFGLTGEDLYDNSKITYEVQGITPYETVLEPGKNYSFTIKFKYTGNDTSDNTLTSRLNFRFMEKPELAVTNEGEITGIYPGYTPQEYEFKVSNYNGDIINNVDLSYGLTAEIQKPFTAKIYDANGAEVTSSTAIDVEGKNAETGAVSKVDHTYKLKIMWDNTNPETDVPYNNAEYAGQTYTAKINLVATPKPNADGDKKYANYTLTQEKDITVKTAPIYLTAEPNNTTIEMTNNRGEINLAVSNNNGNEYNPYETKYTISQDNTKYTLYVDEVEYANNITEERTIGTGELITLVEKIWLVPKQGSTLNKEETVNITITITSPYTNKIETKEIKITDTVPPTKPTITGGSESYLASQTISVSEVATDVGTGVQNYEYLVNNTGQAVADASGNVGSTESETSKTFNTDYNGYYIWFRAVDKVGNKGEWSNSQQLNIETTAPTITLGTNENTTWSQTGSVTVKLQDTTSGLASGASIKYGWSTTTNTEPDNYTVATLPSYTDGTTTEVTFNAEASGLTGKYYLWVVPTTLKDKAGNTQTTIAKSTGQFYFDNKGPTAPTISGGGTGWVTSRTVKVDTDSTDTGVGTVSYYQYYYGSTAPTSSTGASGSLSTGVKSKAFSDNCNGYYVSFRGVDSLGNVGTWSTAQRLYIDINKPTVSAKSTATAEVTEGTSTAVALSTYFNTDANGNAPITSTVFTDTSNSNAVVTTTGTLAVGTHVIRCTVTKENGLSAYADKTIKIVSAGPPQVTTATSIQSKTTEYQDAKGNKVVVPGGFKVVTSLATTVDKGIVIEDSSGNQFVWVPIGTITKSDGTKVTIDLGRYTFASDGTPTLKQAASNYTAEVRLPEDYSLNTSHIAELTTSRVGSSSTNATAINLAQFISKTTSNKGYYIARYEASSSSTGNSKSGLAPTTAITQPNASVAARKMYNGNSYVVSDLVNSYMWDTAIVYIQKCSSKTNYAYQGTSDGKTYNTGASSDVVCNIYDMSGSVCEWGTEHSNYVEFDEEFGYEYDCPCVFTGIWMSNGYVAAGKNSLEATFLDSKIGFRVGLYVL